MIRRDRRDKSNRISSRKRASEFERNSRFANSEMMYGPQYGYRPNADDDYDRYWSEDSDFGNSQFRFDDQVFGRDLRGQSREDFRRDTRFGGRSRRDEQPEDRSFGRFKGTNRFGEESISPDYYEDERGMRHSRSGVDHADYNWSRDPRSEASSESHFGKGPKGYQRSDERIHEDVCEALMRDFDLDASDIDVVVEKGIVTLKGEVDSRQEKKLAEHVAENVRGVRDVYNHLSSYKSIEGWIPGVGDVAEDNNDAGIEKAMKKLEDKEQNSRRA